MANKLMVSTRIADEIKDIFGMDDYGGYTDFDVEEDKSYEGEWIVSFKMLGVPMRIRVRETAAGDRLEYNVHEDTWEEFDSYSYKAKMPILNLLYDTCAIIQKSKK